MSDPACTFCGRALQGPESFCEACDSAVDVEKVLGVLPAPPPRTALPPREIGRFRVVRPVGEGGAGVVYEALDPLLGRSVALKLLKPLGLSAEILERFLREARVLARFRHPHVVQIFELGRHAGRDYLAMEFVEGKRFPATADLREAVR
ncbi:MAG TPA: protein kinase, partial [Planctomycetota bacterium]|nr:protein kinase [Planctomycetota bacterium]